MTFSGFSEETFAFMRGLAKNNDKAWFDAHRGDYEAHYLGPAKAFVEAIGPRLAKLSPDLHAEPRVNGSIFRINRDVRFSKDRSPYRTHLDMWFWEGPEGRRSKECPGLFFRLTPDTLIVGGGMHVFDKAMLARYRDAVVDDARGKELARAVKKVGGHEGVTLGGGHYKKVPRGYDPDHPRAELLKHNGLHAAWEGPPPAEVHGAKLVTFCLGKFRQVLPIHRWVVALA